MCYKGADFTCIHISMYPHVHVCMYPHILVFMYSFILVSMYSQYACILISFVSMYSQYACILISSYPGIHVFVHPGIHVFMHPCIHVSLRVSLNWSEQARNGGLKFTRKKEDKKTRRFAGVLLWLVLLTPHFSQVHIIIKSNWKMLYSDKIYINFFQFLFLFGAAPPRSVDPWL